MDELYVHYAKQNKPVTEKYEFYLHDIPRTVGIQRQKVEWYLPRAGRERGIESCCLMGTDFQFCREESSGDEFHNNVNVLN